MKCQNKKAFSFVEIMVVVFISTIVFAGIYATFNVGNQVWLYYSASTSVKQEARKALLWMVRELREAQNVQVIAGGEGSAIHFYRPSVGAVSYTWSGQGGDARKIIRRNDLSTRVLAQNISMLSFEYLKNAVVIDVKASIAPMASEQAVQVTLREKVTLRSQTPFFR